MGVLAAIVLCLALVWGRYAAAANRVEATGYAMGSYVQQTVYGSGAQEAADTALQEVTALENRISWRVEGSDIARLNNEAGSEWVDIDPQTASLLEMCLQVAEASGGMFDPTILPVSTLWNFDQPEEFSPPSQSTLDQFLPYVNWEDLRVDTEENRASLKYHYMGIDLGSVGKGAGCDAAAAAYQEAGVSGIVSVGGSVGMYGQKPDGSLWSVAVRNPFSQEDGQATMGTLALQEGFLSTSGSYEKQATADGVTYHHLLNPKTGMPENNELVSVTVYTKESGALSDALSTAAFLLGAEEGAALLEKFGAEGLFLFQDKSYSVTDGLSSAFTLELASFHEAA